MEERKEEAGGKKREKKELRDNFDKNGFLILLPSASNVKSLKVHLPLLVEFLQLTQSRDSAMLVCAAATAIGNLSTDEGNKKIRERER